MKEKIISLGYKEWKSAHLLDYQDYFLQKRVDSKSVCDLNEKLFINIKHNNLNKIYENVINSFDVELIAEKNNQWYNFKCYGIKETEFLENLDRIEQNLINAFNQVI